MRTNASAHQPGMKVRPTAVAAGPRPSASDAQKRRPYSLRVSATSCPTVRVSGGSGGGKGSRFRAPFLATGLR